MPLDITTLTAQFRTDMSDPELPGGGDDTDSLWQDAEIQRYIYLAQEDLCEEVDLLYDRTSFNLTTVTDTDLYALSEKVTKVRRGKGEDNRDLPAVSIKELDRRYQAEDLGWLTLEWESKTGEPQYLVTDFATGFLRTVPIPTANEAGEVITLDVYRLPADATLEIPEKYRENLLWKAKSLAYLKDDVDVQDLKKAAIYEDLWKEAKKDIDKREKRRNRGPQVVAYGGI